MSETRPPAMSDRPANFDQDIIEQFRANGGRIVSGPFTGRDLLLLTTTGARTGRPLVKPLGYARDGERYVVFASKGGAPTNPAWYHNLVAQPIVRVEVGDQAFEARASLAEGEERDRLYAKQAARVPVFAEYQQMTTRRIPVVLLERIQA